MFAVDDILVADDVLDAPFSCNLGACLGGCCVHGESGAPLEAEECALLDELLPAIIGDLRPEARAVVETEGAWMEEAPGQYATNCVDGRECVFVVYEGSVAKCALQRAHARGRIGFEKPISCHLFPLRVERWGGTTVVNYERIDLCRPAVKHGQSLGVDLADFLRAPLTRRFGADWYGRFRAACQARSRELNHADSHAPA